MGRQFAELPRWEFVIVEEDRGRYRVTARRDGGITGESLTAHPDEALTDLRSWAAKIDRVLVEQPNDVGEWPDSLGFPCGLAGVRSVRLRS